MRNTLLFAGLFLAFTCRAQVIETRNITPFTPGTSVVFERITVARTGSDIFVQGSRNGKLALFIYDGISGFKDISKESERIYGNPVMLFSRADSMAYMYTDRANLGYWYENDYGSSGFKEWELNRELYSPKPTVFGLDRKGDLFMVGGIFSTPKNGNHYLWQRSMGSKNEKDWIWTPVKPKKTPPEITAVFESSQMKQIQATSKDNIYVLLQDLSSPKNSIVRWNGKAWNIINEQPDTIRNILVDDGGILYANGNFRTPDGKDCILRWDGSVWSNMPIDGFRRGTPKLMALDEKGSVYLGGLSPSSKEFFILESDGASFRYFGAAPAPMHDMIVFNGQAYTIGNGKEGGVFVVPKGGLITANTMKRPGERKDKYAQRVYEFSHWYGENFLSGTQPFFDDIAVYLKQPNKDNGLVMQNSMRTMKNSSFIKQVYDTLTALKKILRQGDNIFFEYLKELISEQLAFYELAGYVGEYAQGMYYNDSDRKRDKDKLSEQYKKSVDLGNILGKQLVSYQQRNPEVQMRNMNVVDAKAPVKPNEKTLELYETFKSFSKAHSSLMSESDRLFSALKTAPNADAATEAIRRHSSAATNERLLLYSINSKLAAMYPSEMQPEASPFHTTFKAFIEARLELLKNRTDFGDRVSRPDLSIQTKSGYGNIAARQENASRNAEERFQKALTTFKEKFTLQ